MRRPSPVFNYLTQTSLLFALWLFTLGGILAVSAATLNDPRFRIHEPSYAYLDCSACIAFADHLGRRMNASLEYDGRGGASFLATHRLNTENKLQRNLYATSELRAVEVLEKVCNDSLEENYVLRLDTDRRIRVYASEKSDLPFAQYYSAQDSDALKAISSTAVRAFCTRVMGEEEEAMMTLVREVRELAELERRMCGGNDVNTTAATSPAPPIDSVVTAVCFGIEASLDAELRRIQRYEKWQDSITARREKAIEESGGRSNEPIIAKPVAESDANARPWFTMRRPNGDDDDDDNDDDDDDKGNLEADDTDL